MRSTVVLLCLVFVSHAAIPDLSKFKDREPDVVRELKKLHYEKVLPVIKEVAKDVLRPQFDVTKALRKLKQIQDEYQNDGQFLIQRYSSQAQYKKAELHQVDKIITSEIQRMIRSLRDNLGPKLEQLHLGLLRRKNETLYKL